MLPPVRCPTCGRELSHLATVYNYIRAKRMKAHFEQGTSQEPRPLPELAWSDPLLQAGGIAKGVLDQLGITECCRVRVIANVDLDAVY